MDDVPSSLPGNKKLSVSTRIKAEDVEHYVCWAIVKESTVSSEHLVSVGHQSRAAPSE
jgi:hypothetical protein